MDVRELKERVNISDWLCFLGVERKGGKDNFLCPFHAEKNPSFNVYKEKNIVIDFHDNAAYDHISIAQELKGWDFQSAVKHLADYAGVNGEFVTTTKVLSAQEGFIKTAKSYFEENKNWILSKFAEIKGYNIPDNLHKYLLYVPENYNHPQRGRLVLVWRDIHGCPIGLVGRTLSRDVKPKYLYSGVLAGEKFRKTHPYGSDYCGNSEKVIVVEGIMDAFIARSSRCVVATGGAVAPKFSLFKDFSRLKAIILSPDPDSAGQIATIKSISEFYEEAKVRGIDVFIAEMEKDLDELIMSGKKVSDIIESAEPVTSYLSRKASMSVSTVAGSIVKGTAQDAIIAVEDTIVQKISNRSIREVEILYDIAKLSYETEKQKYLTMMAKARKVSKTALEKDLKKIERDLSVKASFFATGLEDTIVHPSYHINENIVVLGFTISAISNDTVVESPVWVISQNGNHYLYFNHPFELNGKRYILDTRNGQRTCPPLEKYVGKAALLDYISKGRPTCSLNRLFRKIVSEIEKYVDIENKLAYKVIGMYIILTYFHRCFDSIPFVFVYGPKGSGKSQLLQILSLLCFNAVKVKGTSFAAVADTIDSWRGTYIIDQAESLSLPQNVELVGFLADSYTAHGGKRRIVQIKNGNRSVIECETFSPKIFASIREIDDDIKDRCIIINMLKSSKQMPSPDFTSSTWKKIRAELYKHLLYSGVSMYDHCKALMHNYSNSSRVQEIISVVSVFCDACGFDPQDKNDIVRYILENSKLTQYELQEDEKSLFEVLLDMCGLMETTVVTEKEIKAQLNAVAAKERDTRWILSKMKQFGLIKDILKEKDSSGKGRKLLRINKADIERKYEKYFFCPDTRVETPRFLMPSAADELLVPSTAATKGEPNHHAGSPSSPPHHELIGLADFNSDEEKEGVDLSDIDPERDIIVLEE